MAATALQRTSGAPIETSNTATVQQILIDLGFSVGSAGADGIWGANSRAALKKAAPAAGGIYLKSERKGKSVVIAPKGLTILLAGVRALKMSKQLPAVAGGISGWILTKSLQLTLKNLGYLKEGQVDGKFGPTTKGALEKAVGDLGISYSSSRSIFNQDGVVLNPLSAYLELVKASVKRKTAPKRVVEKPKIVMKEVDQDIETEEDEEEDGEEDEVEIPTPQLPKPTPKPTPTPKKVQKLPSTKVVGRDWRALAPGLTIEEPVIEVQRILRKLGWRKRAIALDGKYGPKTAGAWNSSASTRGLDGRSWKVTLKKVRVITSAFEAMKKEAFKPRKPTPAPKPKLKPAGEPGQGYASRDVQTLLKELGVNIKADNIWGPKSRNALKSAAISNGFRYISSTGYSGQKMVRVNPGDLIPKLQGVLTARRKKEALDAAKKAKAEAKAKKVAAAEAEKRRQEAAAKAEAERQKRAAAEKKARRQKRRAKKKEMEAKRAEEKAAQTKKEADRKEADRRKKEAAAAQVQAEREIAAAQEAEQKAAEQQARADSAGRQADTASQDARDSAREAGATTGQAREAYREAQQQEASGAAQKTKMVKAGVGISPMMLAAGGSVALGVALMMGKKEEGPPTEWFE